MILDSRQIGCQLAQGDPLPQTTYKIAVNPGAAQLLNIPLRIKA